MYTLTGIKMKNPIILAAGVLGTTGASLCRVALEGGADAVVTKSIGSMPKKGHSNPTIVQLDGGFLNAMGLPNPSYSDFLQELKIAKKYSGVPVIASIFGGTVVEFMEVAEGLLPGKPDAFELNVSCPHSEGYGAAVGSNACLVEAITAAVKDIVNVPVWVKLTPNVSDITCVGTAAESGGADAVVAINTLKGMAIDIESGYPILGNRSGGLSGKAVKPIAVKCIYDLYTTLKIPVIGVGGVSCWQDAVEMMMAGAAAVQVGSAVYERIDIFYEINKGIKAFLQRKSYSDVKELIGLSHEMV